MHEGITPASINRLLYHHAACRVLQAAGDGQAMAIMVMHNADDHA
jgi:hypothetical protein